jgi:hypothetical protein
MKKSDVYSQVLEVLVAHKAKQPLIEAIEAILKPKTGGGVVQFPMIVDNNINYHYCRYTGYYLPESEMVMSNGKSKGYSKKAIALWTKYGRDAQKLNDEAMQLLLNNQIVKGQAKAKEAEELKNQRNYNTMYDSVREEYEDIKLAQ